MTDRPPRLDPDRIRDIPRSCTCLWERRWWPRRHERTLPDPECPWHASGPLRPSQAAGNG